jgi:hypothetical protein
VSIAALQQPTIISWKCKTKKSNNKRRMVFIKIDAGVKRLVVLILNTMASSNFVYGGVM